MIQVYGDVLVDKYIEGHSTRMSPEAPVPVVDVTKRYSVVGGAMLVASTIDVMQNLSVTSLSTISSKPPVKTRVVANGKQFVRFDVPRSAPVASYSHIEIKETTKAAIVVDYDYGHVTHELIDMLKSNDVKIFGDAKRNFRLFQGCYCLKSNKKEFEDFFNTTLTTSNWIEKIQAARKELNVEVLIVTLGAAGAYVCYTDACCFVEAPKVDMIDVTGAGDIFMAVFVNEMVYCNKTPLGATQSACDYASNFVAFGISSKKETVVFTNGCFDILHPGHVSLLAFCRYVGTKVIVGLNSDNSIKRLKGNDRPIMSFELRKYMLLALDCVDEVYEFDEDTPAELIDKIKPDVIVKGSDYDVADVVSGGRPVILYPNHNNISTTSIIRKIRND